MCSMIVVGQYGEEMSFFTWLLKKFPFRVCIEQVPLSCYQSIVQDRSLSLLKHGLYSICCRSNHLNLDVWRTEVPVQCLYLF